MEHVLGLQCVRCARKHDVAAQDYVCTSCGENLEVCYDYEKLKGQLDRERLSAEGAPSILRYFPLLPLRDPEKMPSLQIGWSPLYPAPELAQGLGMRTLYIKDDTRNPSASFKDRASAVALAHCREEGRSILCGASTGNAASSTACLAAKLPLETIIFLPHTAPRAKIAQLLVFGAHVYTVEGSYDDAFDLCLQATAEYGWYNRNTGYNPYTREGKKTCSYEICEQLSWQPPDRILVPVGDGNIISGIWKGLRDLYALGWIEQLPRVDAVQSRQSNAVVCALQEGGDIEAVEATTVADSISVDLPRDGWMALRAVRESGGVGLEVDDEEILEAIPLLARKAGIFAEPSGATSLAGLKKGLEKGLISPEESVVCLATGNGLKDIDSAIRLAGSTCTIPPSLEALQQHLPPFASL